MQADASEARAECAAAVAAAAAAADTAGAAGRKADAAEQGRSHAQQEVSSTAVDKSCPVHCSAAHGTVTGVLWIWDEHRCAASLRLQQLPERWQTFRRRTRLLSSG